MLTLKADLDMVRSILIQQFGPDFARSATGNRDNHVSSRVVRATSAPLPSASLLNQYLKSVAQNYGVKWTPEPRREEMFVTWAEFKILELTFCQRELSF